MAELTHFFPVRDIRDQDGLILRTVVGESGLARQVSQDDASSPTLAIIEGGSALGETLRVLANGA
jgi:hypothetical protein